MHGTSFQLLEHRNQLHCKATLTVNRTIPLITCFNLFLSDFAILGGNVELVKLLINAGADVNVGSPIIGRPLHIVLSEKVPPYNWICLEVGLFSNFSC